MSLLTLRNIHLAFGGPPLLDGISFSVNSGERVCVIGRNGTGKSTLLKLVIGHLNADQGERELRQGTKVAYLEQELPTDISGSVFTVVAQGLGNSYALVNRYHEISLALEHSASAALLEQFTSIQQDLDATDGWRAKQRVETILSRMELDPDCSFANLSGGLKRRVLLGRALVCDPEILLLDEPTNHLDIDAIAWLEGFLLNFSGALLFVTHDRRFLQRLATRILELDRGQLTDWPGDYANYLRRCEERCNAEHKTNERFDKRLAQEEVWIRQGIKARRTRNEGRVRALEQLRRERQNRRESSGKIRIQQQDIARSGRLVVEAEGLHYTWQVQPVVRDFSTLIMRGDKVGILGPNGCGKTTLINLLLGNILPNQGQIRHGTNIEIAYFDQQRLQLDENATVQASIGEGSDTVVINGKPRHVISYLQDFLFTPERAKQPVSALSGGERNRLLLARLLARPANLLVLDEPTNDLDIETLELLEDLLLSFAGTLLLVSHDREFLDNLVTSTIAYVGNGRFKEYVGGYQDWVRQRDPMVIADVDVGTKTAKHSQATPNLPANRAETYRLSFKEQKELAALPNSIELLETEQATLQACLGKVDFYRKDPSAIGVTHRRLQQIETELRTSYARWEYLEAKRSN